MNLSISNIAWTSEADIRVYTMLQQYGFNGIEIAPTRIFPNNPYDKIDEAKQWRVNLKKNYGLEVSSMQSIWYGRKEKLFGTDRERHILLEYTKKSIEFAIAVGCRNIVFGCPQNRQLVNGVNKDIAVDFFREIGEYAVEHGTVIGLEPNPIIYNTDYINTTESALKLIKSVKSDGFKLNLDIGAMVYNKENIRMLEGKGEYINHVHISEPGLMAIDERYIHKELRSLLQEEKYQGFVSIEMKKQENMSCIENVVKYVSALFG